MHFLVISELLSLKLVKPCCCFCDLFVPFTTCVLISGPLTAMSERHRGHMHTLETRTGVGREVTNAIRSLPQWRSLPTWKRRKKRTRRGATTQTTLHRLHSRSTTEPRSTGVTTQTNTRVPNPSRSLNPAPLNRLLLPARRSATAKPTKNPAVTTIKARRRGTGMRSGSGGGSSSNRKRRPIKWEERGRDQKGRSTPRTENSRVWRTSPPSTARSLAYMTARGKRRNEEETTVSWFVVKVSLKFVQDSFPFLCCFLLPRTGKSNMSILIWTDSHEKTSVQASFNSKQPNQRVLMSSVFSLTINDL